MHISPSHAKILGDKFSASGVSPKWVKRKRRKRERERLNDGNKNDQLRIANATSGGALKAAWANMPFLQKIKFILAIKIKNFKEPSRNVELASRTIHKFSQL